MQDGAADRTIGGVYLWKPSASHCQALRAVASNDIPC